MKRDWTFGWKVGAGFAAILLLAAVMAAVAVYALETVVEDKDRVISVNTQLLIDAERVNAAFERKSSAGRGFMLTADERFLADIQEARADVRSILDRLRGNVVNEEGRQVIADVARLEDEHQRAVDRITALRRTNPSLDAIALVFDNEVAPVAIRVRAALTEFAAGERRLLDAASRGASQRASSATTMVTGIAVLSVIVGAIVAFILTRSLTRQIGSAVGHVQSSSAELQAAANQQATGAREQAAAMTEISTTITELLATSRQIAESAQRVAEIAQETAGGARAGQQTVEAAHDSIAGIRRQVDLIVGHMVELGRKSQQIGAVLEIVSELADQTNILAVNATIEAAGAGEAGKRFAVVADEIRKLADRVGGSTKEIRSLIEEIRTATNTTIMATESGAKVVDVGAKQFGEVAAAFKQIAAQVGTTTEAAREIELSTKQQTTAVEQVKVAIANVAQATHETESSSGQTLQTASQLARLSNQLLRLVQPQPSTVA